MSGIKKILLASTLCVAVGSQNAVAQSFMFRSPGPEDPVPAAQSSVPAPLAMTEPVFMEMQTVGRGIAISRQASVSGGEEPYSWRLDGAPSWVHIDEDTGQIFGSVDERGGFVFTIVVTDFNGDEVSGYGIIDADEPMQLLRPVVDETYVGDPVNVILNADVEGGRGPFEWTISSGPAWLAADLDTGYLHGLAGDQDVGNNVFTLQVVDERGRQDQITYGFDVRSVPEISDFSTETAIRGLDIVFAAQPQGRGGKSPYTWSLEAGAPTWLSINSDTGALAGSPDVNGIFPFTINMEDINGVVATLSTSIEVADMVPEKNLFAHTGELETRHGTNYGVTWGSDVSISNDGTKAAVWHQVVNNLQTFELVGDQLVDFYPTYGDITNPEAYPAVVKMSADGSRIGGAYLSASNGSGTNRAAMWELNGNRYDGLPMILPDDWFEESLEWGKEYAISGDGNTFAVTSDKGWVWINEFDGTTWRRVDSIRAQNSAVVSDFGKQLEFSDDGNRLAISATRTIKGEKRTIVYVVEKQGDDWPLYPGTFENAFWMWGDLNNRPDAARDMAFSGDGTRLVVTSSRGVNAATVSGSVHVFDRVQFAGLFTWKLSKSIELENPTSYASFGSSVDISYDGNTIVVGASRDNVGQGAAYVFEYQDDDWYERQKLTAAGMDEGAMMGSEAVISGDGGTILLHSPGDDIGTIQMFKR